MKNLLLAFGLLLVGSNAYAFASLNCTYHTSLRDERVLVIGQNETTGEFAAYLSGGSNGSIGPIAIDVTPNNARYFGDIKSIQSSGNVAITATDASGRSKMIVSVEIKDDARDGSDYNVGRSEATCKLIQVE